MTQVKEISLRETIGQGYDEFWKSKHRYRVVKGSRASKKSVTAALNFIVKMMEYPDANLLVVRKTFRTIQDSCYSQLKWAVHRLGVEGYWDFKLSPLEAIYKPTGQRIFFRGLDDPLKITSITVPKGYLCWLWIEEAYEIDSENDFDMLDESLRGEMSPHLYKSVTLTMNPWNERHWIKARFFDEPDQDTLAMTTNYLCNEWLDDADRALFERMKERNPRRYQVAGLGEWGVTDGLVYERWEERRFNRAELLEEKPHLIPVFGLDYGYTNDPSAFFCGLLDNKDPEDRTLYVFDEFYKSGMSNRAIALEIGRMGYRKEKITADSAEPKSNDELRSYGLRISGAVKGKDSVANGIQWIQDINIVIHPRCENFLNEISSYTWAKDRFDKSTNKPIDDNNHLMDAMRYALERFVSGPTYSF